jgi:heat shock protein 5
MAIERLIGEAAKNQAAANPERTIYDAKRLIGRQFNNAVLQRDMKMLLERNQKPHVRVQVRQGDVREFSPEEVSAMVLTKMKETAEAYVRKYHGRRRRRPGLLRQRAAPRTLASSPGSRCSA